MADATSTCDTGALLADAACFTCLPDGFFLPLKLSLLSSWLVSLGGPDYTQNTQGLIDNAACFTCLSRGQQQILRLQLLCNILTSLGGNQPEPPTPPEDAISWEPAELDLPSLIGKAAYANASNMAGITSLTISDTGNREGYDFEFCPDLVTLTFDGPPVITDNGYILIIQNPVLETIDLANATIRIVTVSNNPSLTTLDLSGCTFTGTAILLSDNAALQSVNMTGSTIADGTNLNLGNCALDEASVDNVLAAAVANAGYVSGNLTTSGGTSSPPSVTGAADAATLSGRGIIVSTN